MATTTAQVTVETDEDQVDIKAVKPFKDYGEYDSQRVRRIFQEWKKSGPKADIAEEHIESIINFEFAESERPSKESLLDSVLREPKIKKTGIDRYDVRTGARLPPDQKWFYDPDTGRDFGDKGLHFQQGQFVEFLGNGEFQRYIN